MIIIMSNITVIPRFQKTWAHTSDLLSAGTSTFTGCPTNISAPFNVFPLTPWASSKVSVPPMAAPPSCRPPAPVLSYCTVLLLIFGSYLIVLGTRSRAPRDPHSFAASSCRARTMPPFGHDRACLIKNFLPQPSQVAGMSCGIIPYLRRRLSRNSS